MTITFPFGAVEYAEQLTPEEHRALRANNRRRLGVLESAPKVTHITSVAGGADNTRRAPEANPFAGMYLPEMHEAVSGPAEASNANAASEPLIKPGKQWD
jgi:hypothetical protein